MIKNPLIKRLCVFIIFTIVSLMTFVIYIEMHEYVHEKNCIYHDGIYNQTSFTHGECFRYSPDMANLDVINEMVGSIIFFVFLTVYIIMVWIIWR